MATQSTVYRCQRMNLCAMLVELFCQDDNSCPLCYDDCEFLRRSDAEKTIGVI